MLDSYSLPEQLDIMITTHCQAKCKFCIQEATYQPSSRSMESFLSSLKNSVDLFVKAGGKKIVITGGEPLLKFPKVLAVLGLLKQYPPFELVALYTNGQFLTRSSTDMSRVNVDLLADTCLTDLNLSVHHYNDEINNYILGLPKKPSTLLLSKAIANAGLRFRLNCVVQRSGINSHMEVARYCKQGFDYGASSIYFRDLFKVAFDQPISDGRFNPLHYIDDNRLDIEQLVSEMKAFSGFEFTSCSRESFRDKTEWRFVDRETDKPVFFSKLTVGNESRDGIPYLVAMPDGRLYRGWLGREDRLLVSD